MDEAEKQKAGAEALLKDPQASEAQREQARNQLRQANAVIAQYGAGSDLQMAIRAVTGALQGLASGNTGAAIVGGLSPYANLAIKNLTQGNDTANIMAHAVLGAIEAQASGNNALAGAAGAATGEATAQFITQYLYKKPAKDLTESEKQTVSALSQFASGLAGATVGNSTQSAVGAMETGKRAVENNNLVTAGIQKGYPVIRNVICAQKCLNAIAGMGIGASIVLSGSEIEDAIKAGISADPQKIAALSDLQRQYLNEQVLHDPHNIFLGGQVWIPNADGGFSPIDPELMPKNPEGKPILDPRIFVNHTGDIQYPADYEIPHNTGGSQILEQDKNSNILVGGETNVGDWRDNVVTRDNRLPIPEPVRAKNGLTIESNEKHTPGARGYNPKAGTEPRNSKDLFESSIPTSDPLVRLAIDNKGNIHRFSNNNRNNIPNKDIYHWTGSTGDASSPMTIGRELYKFNKEIKELKKRYKESKNDLRKR